MSSESSFKESEFVKQNFESIKTFDGTEVDKKIITGSIIKGEVDGIIRFGFQRKYFNKYYTPGSKILQQIPKYLPDKNHKLFVKAEDFTNLYYLVCNLYAYGYSAGFIEPIDVRTNSHDVRQGNDDNGSLQATTTCTSNAAKSFNKAATKLNFGPIANGGGGGSKRPAEFTQSTRRIIKLY